MRAIADTMVHEETRSTMERLADSYDEMADSMERRLNKEPDQASGADEGR